LVCKSEIIWFWHLHLRCRSKNLGRSFCKTDHFPKKLHGTLEWLSELN
jgi:hypothetical protein